MSGGFLYFRNGEWQHPEAGMCGENIAVQGAR